jgi:DNA (cytosine-5)-methyltransferase 1
MSGLLIPEVANPLTARMHKGVNTTMDEGQTMIAAPFAFKASYFTREKDGAPSDVFPPLSADADKGDQDPLICAPVAFTQNSRSEVRMIGGDGGVVGALAADAGVQQQNYVAQPIAFDSKASGRNGFGVGEISPTLRAMNGGPDTHKNGGGQVAVAFQPRFARNGRGGPDEVAAALTGEAGRTGKGDSAQVVVGPETAWRVRRLTPVECERLQGMADGYTNIPWRGKNGAPDGQRYRALGNSMSVNVMRWIGRRIEMVEEIPK